jgi:hypothetical protein
MATATGANRSDAATIDNATVNLRNMINLNRLGFDAASFFEKDADYVEALPGRAA